MESVPPFCIAEVDEVILLPTRDALRCYLTAQILVGKNIRRTEFG